MPSAADSAWLIPVLPLIGALITGLGLISFNRTINRLRKPVALLLSTGDVALISLGGAGHGAADADPNDEHTGENRDRGTVHAQSRAPGRIGRWTSVTSAAASLIQTGIPDPSAVIGATVIAGTGPVVGGAAHSSSGVLGRPME